MNGYMKVSIIIAAIVGILTFAVSIPANLLGTSLLRSALSFLFFMVMSVGAHWILHRFGSKEADTTERDDSHTGRQIDWQTPEDNLDLSDIVASPDQKEAMEEAPFEPLSAPQVDAEQLAEVIRKKALDNDTSHEQ